MAETIANFQSQLSGVMETVFKAAIFEITRLVEDSFLEEMNRCGEQVESLKKRLKWSESRRNEGDGRGRCKDCGRRGVSGEKDPGESAVHSTFLSIHQCIHSSIYQCIHPSMHPSNHACIHPSNHACIHPSPKRKFTYFMINLQKSEAHYCMNYVQTFQCEMSL